MFNCIFYWYLIDLSLALEVSEAIAIIITQRHCILVYRSFILVHSSVCIYCIHSPHCIYCVHRLKVVFSP